MGFMKTVETEAIVLHASDYGESDRIVSFYTLEAGLVRGIAKGARRSRKRFVNSLETGSVVHLSYRVRRGLFWVEGCKLLELHEPLRSDFFRWGHACLLCEAVLRMSPEGLNQPELFHLLRRGLERLGSDRDPWNVTALFLLRLVVLSGNMPALERCSQCGKGLERGQGWIWNLPRGLLLCPEHGLQPSESVSLDRGSVLLMRLAAAAPPEKLWRMRFRKDTARALVQAMATWIEHQSGRRLRCMKILNPPGAVPLPQEERNHRGMDESI
ncbi:MAG: recO [Desulfacinum sp.]|jgi:DNA repair protein RecO (recombination protein O)|nr:recO [Desulfacinum sp.]